jgi:hypothetical protein
MVETPETAMAAEVVLDLYNDPIREQGRGSSLTNTLPESRINRSPDYIAFREFPRIRHKLYETGKPVQYTLCACIVISG